MPDNDEALRAATVNIMIAYQTLISQKRFDEWIELWAEDGELDFPFAPAGRKRIYRGKREILAYMSGTTGKVAIDGTESMRLFPMQDPTMAVVELTIKGHVPASGAAYNQSYVLFFEVEDGKLKRYREYWNPLVSIDATGDRAAWTASFGSPEKGAAA